MTSPEQQKHHDSTSKFAALLQLSYQAKLSAFSPIFLAQEPSLWQIQIIRILFQSKHGQSYDNMQ